MDNILKSIGTIGAILTILFFILNFSKISNDSTSYFFLGICFTALIQSFLVYGFGESISLLKDIKLNTSRTELEKEKEKRTAVCKNCEAVVLLEDSDYEKGKYECPECKQVNDVK